MSRFTEGLNEQIANEFAASQQYVAIAVHYDSRTLPQLAAHFYRQAVEERNHAMMIVQYLLDADSEVLIPGVREPQTSFEDDRAPVELALEQEKTVTKQIAALVQIARDEHDYVGDQFLGWFLEEQREEVASMSALLSLSTARARPTCCSSRTFSPARPERPPSRRDRLRLRQAERSRARAKSRGDDPDLPAGIVGGWYSVENDIVLAP